MQDDRQESVLARVGIYGLCVVQESSSEGTKHIVYPIKEDAHSFILDIPNTTKGALSGELKSYAKAFPRKWIFEFPENTLLEIQKPDAPEPIENDFEPASMEDLRLGRIDPRKLANGTLGAAHLPYNKHGYGWVDYLGKVKFHNKSERKVADRFEWLGHYDNGTVTITVTLDSGHKEAIVLKKDRHSNLLSIEIGSEILGKQGEPFCHWKGFGSVSTLPALDEHEPVVTEKPMRHINSPSCPPVKC